jgi:3-methyl-2-oxobutanoate hydroxymethyltransferase
VPKFVKEFGKVGEAIREAISAYAVEVRSRAFPAPEHTYGMRDAASSAGVKGSARPKATA